MHTPDNWVILKIRLPEETFYKVLAGWSGGYLDGDSWRMNSGIVNVTEDGNYYLFSGSSGSIYKCHKETETLRMNNAHVYEQMQQAYPDTIEIIKYVDFVKEFTIAK